MKYSLLLLVLLATFSHADDIEEIRKSFLLEEGQEFEATITARPREDTDRLLDMYSYTVRFPSPIKTAVENNNVIDGILFEPASPTDRAIIFMPWFKDGDTKNAELICRTLALGGYKVFFMPLGYQFSRAPEGYGTGSYIFRNSPDHIKEWARQGVQDVQRTREWLVRDRGVKREKVGIVGVSLGGLITALTYGTIDDFPAAAFILTGGNYARYLKLAHELGIDMVKKDMDKIGLDPNKLDELLRGYDPIHHADPSRKHGILMVNGLFDPVIPFPAAQDLWKAWGKPSRMILPTGHVTTALLSPILLARVIVHMNGRLGD